MVGSYFRMELCSCLYWFMLIDYFFWSYLFKCGNIVSFIFVNGIKFCFGKRIRNSNVC